LLWRGPLRSIWEIFLFFLLINMVTYRSEN
jgi:hypothetical protein